jgi:7,8-dihydropterin-6-yl-methyl-4-(beta-D-ribofuranosyl)aminobenzene 5'-phosphate synthase
MVVQTAEVAVKTLVALALWSSVAAAAPHRAGALGITVLSTMLADAGFGEWGFAALVEVDGRQILFDTGAHPDTVSRNARELGIDLSRVTDVILSHNHGDHTTGMLPLRRELMAKNPAALSRIHVGRGALWSRPSKDGEQNQLLVDRAAIEATGAKFIEHDAPVELSPGVWLTGPVPRVHPERNWTGTWQLVTPTGTVEDTLPEDQSLVIDTAEGLVLLSGCGHAGVINTVEYARKIVRAAPLHAAIGGFHLFDKDDDKLAWTIAQLRAFGLQHLLGAHCTGIEAVYRIRAGAGLDRRRCVVASVGSRFVLGRGIEPGRVAR